MSTLMPADEIVDRILKNYLQDADDLVATGLTAPGDVDLAMRLGAGHRSGPFELRGLDAGRGEDGVAAAPFSGTTVVVGSGRMASGIVEAIARSGSPVMALARSQNAAAGLIATVDASLDRAVARAKLTAEDAAHVRALVSTSSDAANDAAVGEPGLLIEAIVEDLPTKQRELARLDLIYATTVPFATNTSSFTVRETVADVITGRPTLSLHFFNPAQAMRLVEVVAGPGATPEVVDRATAWVHSIRKTPVRAPDARGFIVNRLLIPMLNDAVHLHESGVPIADIDQAMTERAGHPMGPFALMDMIGIDVMVAALTALAAGGEERIRPARSLRELVAAGRLGRKTGGGFLMEGKQQ